MEQEIHFQTGRKICAHIECDFIEIPKGSSLIGILSLAESDGPLQDRPFQKPSYIDLKFTFTINGISVVRRSILKECDLWLSSGRSAFGTPEEFHVTCSIDGMMDARDDWHYINQDGVLHRNHLKYTSCHIDVSALTNRLCVKCRYYDQNTDIADYVTIFYDLDYTDILFLNDHVIHHDRDGNPEDCDWHGSDFVGLSKT